MAKKTDSRWLACRPARALVAAEGKHESSQHFAPPLWGRLRRLSALVRCKPTDCVRQPLKIFAPHHYKREGFPVPLSPYTGRGLNIEMYRAGVIGATKKIAPGERHGIVAGPQGVQPETAAWETGARHARREE
jgi:hypothetical protein